MDAIMKAGLIEQLEAIATELEQRPKQIEQSAVERTRGQPFADSSAIAQTLGGVEGLCSHAAISIRAVVEVYIKGKRSRRRA